MLYVLFADADVHLLVYFCCCRDMKVLGGAVFWPPKAQQPEAGWIEASDHRSVYLDVEVCAEGTEQLIY
jgi:hypothetical protein